MQRKQLTKRMLLLLLVLTILYAVGKTGCRSNRVEPSVQQQAQELLRVVAVHELILQEAILDIITKAQLDEHGNPVLYFVSAGAFGQTKSKRVLFRGCVQIRYGVDMTDTVLTVTSDGNGGLLLQLPEPRIIGNPVVLTEPPYQSVILDVSGEGWWAGRIARADVQNQIHQAYVKNAANLCDGLGLEQKTKERAEQVLRAFLKPVLDGKHLIIQWEGNPGKTTTTQQQGDTNHVDIKKSETNAVDRSINGGDLVWDWPYTPDGYFASDRSNANDYGFVGYGIFRFPAEPVCTVPYGGIGPGIPGGICIE